MSEIKDLDARRAQLTTEQRAKLAARLKAKPQGAATAIARRHLVQDIPLSPSQRSLWLTWKLEPGNPAYNMAGAIYLKGQLNIHALESSLKALMERHETLRTLIQDNDEDDARQCILTSSALAFHVQDLRSDVNNPEVKMLADELKHFAQTPFNLHTETPFRAALFQITAHDYCLALCLHHIAGDGWSIAILMNELFAFYESFHAGREPSLQPLPIQFSDYVMWQREWFDSTARQRQLDYWAHCLQGQHEPITLPLVRSRESDQHHREARYPFSFSPALSDALRGFAREQGVSLYVVILSLLKFTLYRFSGQKDIRVGTPVANRQQEETRGVVGYLLNLLVLRTQLDTQDSFATLLTNVRDTLIGAQSHQELPFDAVVEALQPERIPGVHPLFQVKCTQQDNLAKRRTVAGLDINIEFISTGRAHFDLSLDFTDRTQQIDGLLIYAADLFDAPTITHFADTLQEAAKRFIHAPDFPLALFEFPNSSSNLVENTSAVQCNSVVEFWRSNFSSQSNRIAIQQNEKFFTYAELDHYSNCLATQLIKQGVVAETRVAIHAERSIEFVTAVVAVLKAGGTYVPLDPALPADRLVYQIKDSGAALLLSTEQVEWNLDVPVLLLNDDVFSESASTNHGSTVPVIDIHPDQAVYVIYTSGSTGKPKGVVVSHGALANYVQALLTRLALPDTAHSMAMVSTVAADLGNTVLFGALCSGRILHLISPECAFDPDAFASYMHQHRVDVLKIVPSHLQALLNAAHPEWVLPETCLIVGGETTRWSLLKQIDVLKPACRVLNHYGPTETTVGVLTQEAHEALTNTSGLPIGQPLDNNQAYVLDAELNPVPLGVAGELYVGGNQIARGYQSRANQTAERFIASPFGNGERLYRTGDRVKLLKDNSLEFLGRVDDQIKVRGYRVELLEIAQLLRAQSGVAHAEVIARENDEGHAKLYGYVVAQPDAAINVEQLRDALRHALPDYMVPDAIQLLESLPLTPNGKLDRKALPDAGQQATKDYVAPQGEVEETLAQIWCEVLGVERVSRDDNFFALGGDSILSLKVVARARKRGLRLAPKQLFEQPSLMSTAQAIVDPTSEDNVLTIPALSEAQRKKSLPLSYAQSRQWFLWQMDPESTAYHISGALRLKGQLNVIALKDSFFALAARHESLRTLFRVDTNGLVEQILVDAIHIAFEEISVAGHDESLVRAEIARLQQTPFDLEQGPLLRVGLIRHTTEEYVLVVVMHHIISDGWSMQVLIDEFAVLYRAQVSGEKITLPVLPIHYVDYAVWQREWLEAGEKNRQLDYWKRQLGNEHPVLQLPTDFPRRIDGRYQAKSQRLFLSQTLVDNIRQQSQAEGATLFVWLLAGFYVLLNKYTGVDDLRVGIPIANRHLPQTENVVGFFVNTQVLRARLDGRMSLTQLFIHVRNLISAAQENQDLPFDQLVEALQPERTLTHSPLFQVMFNHQRKNHQSLAGLPNLALELYDLGEKSALFELMVDSVEWPDGRVSVAFSYAEELFAPEWVNNFANTYLQLLAALVQTPQQLLGDITLGVDNDCELITQASLSQWRGTIGKFAHELAEAQVEKNPQALAVVFAQQQYSYHEINTRANRLAHKLIEAGVAPEVRVGVMLTRSEKSIISLLAILKAGGVYVPLDPEYPANRLQYMLENSGVELLITQDDLAGKIDHNAPLKRLQFDDLDLETTAESNPDINIHPDNLAYILYTSGSTGQPKGIAMSHGVLGQLIEWQMERYPERYNTLLFASPCFDVGIQEVMTGLGAGATLVQTSNEQRHNFAALFELVNNHNVERIYLPFSVLQLYADLALTSGVRQQQLRQVITAGEQLKLTPLLAKWLQQESKCELLNQYGPTETHVVSEYAIKKAQEFELPPIGTPASTAHLYILDSSLQKVPVGVSGELYIGSSVLARGYASRPALSAERFVASPFDPHGGRLYRTGDLVKCNRAGQLEYIGRMDNQIKLRGFRIEPGEIEAQLLVQPEVREAVVTIKKMQGKDILVAYFSLQKNAQLDGTLLRDRLRQSLVDYMVPGKFVLLDNLPLNANGKVDHRALPEVQSTHDAHQPPEGETEVRLAQIWSTVLGINKVGRHDNFFELGGHSLQIIQVVSRIQFEFSVKLSVRDVFQHSALSAMAALIVDQTRAQPATDTFAELSAFIDSLEIA